MTARPAVTRRDALWLALAVALVAFSLATAVAAPAWDTAMWEYAGRAMARGAVLYRDVWDNKPPAIYAVNALLQTLFPGDYRAHQLVEAAVELAGVACFAIWARRVALPHWAVATAAFAFVLALPAAQLDMPEYDAVALQLAGLACLAYGRFAAAGALVAAAAVVWPQGALVLAVPLVAAPSVRARILTLAGAAGAVAVAVVAAVILIGGSAFAELGGAWRSYVAAGGAAGHRPGPSELLHALLTGLDGSAAGPLLFAALAVLHRPRTPLERTVLVWCGALLIAIAPFVSYYDHYFVPLKPALIAALFAFAPRLRPAAWQRMLPRAAAALVALLLLVKTVKFVPAQQASYRTEGAAAQRVGALVGRYLGPGAVVAIRGYEPGIALAADSALPDRFSLVEQPNERWVSRQPRVLRAPQAVVAVDDPDRPVPPYVRVCRASAEPFALLVPRASAARFSGCR